MSILKVISYNLRNSAAGPPDAPWPERLQLLLRFLEQEQPTILGTQEGFIDAITDIADGLPKHYAWEGRGRRGGDEDESCAIFYDTRRIEVLAVSHQWLSDTPEEIASTTWGNELPRMFTALTVRDRESDLTFEVVNTHFDHVSDNARARSAEQLRDRVLVAESAGRPSIVLGDFNAAAGACPEYDILLQTPLRDSYLDAGSHQGIGTFNDYRTPGPGPRIDWILTSPDLKLEAARIIDNRTPDGYPSDHLPVEAVLAL